MQYTSLPMKHQTGPPSLTGENQMLTCSVTRRDHAWLTH